MTPATRNIAATLVLLEGRDWVPSPEIARAVGSSRQAMSRVYARLLQEGFLHRAKTFPVRYRLAPGLTRAQQREIRRIVDEAAIAGVCS